MTNPFVPPEVFALTEADSSPFARRLQQLFGDRNPIPFARELKLGKLEGISNRKMAKMAGCGETHVRDMLLLLKLPPVTQLNIENGASYRRHLPRLRKAEIQQRELERKEAIKPTDSIPVQGAKIIGGWCQKLGVEGGYAEQVLTEVRMRILITEQAGTLRSSSEIRLGAAKDIFKANLPKNYREMDSVQLHAAAVNCIARSLVTMMPNGDIRLPALDLALAKTQRGGW